KEENAARTGIALGGGGARGLAHILTLEVLDECGIRPDRIAGTSMGAIIGTVYAAGVSGAEIREQVKQMTISKDDRVRDIWKKAGNLKNWLKFFKFTKGKEAILSADGFLDLLLEMLAVETFEDLQIPLKVVATDYYRDERVVIESGDLRSALKASMAIPGVFEPVVRDGRVLVDGGMADNLPYDLLQDDCDVVIAVDVQPHWEREATTVPHMVNAVLGMYDSLIERGTQMKLKESPPTAYIRPQLVDIGILDFDKIEDVFRQSEPTMKVLREMLEEMQAENVLPRPSDIR
ncbi:MAG: patatin-like phospholipase family protein, partial [Verrucomicrobiota bacterium]